MKRTLSTDVDVVFIGFVLGHGGDALQMLSLASGLRSRGSRVRIIVPAIAQSVRFAERCEAAGVECERSDLITASMQGARQQPVSVVRLLRSVRAPIVHFHTGNCYLPRTVLLALALLRYRPTFVTLQSPYETIDPDSSTARMWSRAARRRFAAIVSPSRHATAFQVRCGVSEGVAATIRNAIDVPSFAHGDGAEARAVLGVGPDRPIVLFCSRIDAQKRPVDAVRIFASVAGEFPEVLLVFVGSGDDESATAAEAARLALGDRVRFVGYQTNISSWLAAATVWILPTERENFSVAVLEALAAGCAILSTSCRGNDEILVNGQNSRTFPVGDNASAATALRELLGDGDLRRRLGDGARETASHHTLVRMVDDYVALYSKFGAVPVRLRE